MDSNPNSVFQQFLKEGFEKQMEKPKIDVVAIRKHKFSALLEKAHKDLRGKSYNLAATSYYNVLRIVKFEPYPDELDLSQKTDYSIKCCFGYSSLMSTDRFNNHDLNNMLLDIIKELNENFKKRPFPMFLFILLNFYRKRWLTTLTWNHEFMNLTEDEKDSDHVADFFKELLPNLTEMRTELETFEEVAYFGYGENLMRTSFFLPRLNKLKNWVGRLDEFILSKVLKSGSPLSDVELHAIFHQDVFPIWCLANDHDPNSCYSNKFASSCTECIHAKLCEALKPINGKEKEDMPEEQLKLDKYISQCVEFYQKLVTQPIESFNLRLADANAEEKQSSKKACNVSTQTERLKATTKNIQTDIVKTKNAEVQVGTDSDMLNALLEIKNKCLVMQAKKDETIAKLTKRINEMQEKASKDAIAKRAAEQEFERRIAKLQFEIQKLKEQLSTFKDKQLEENRSNMSLQKLLVEQINNQYNWQKQQYKTFQRQAGFMVAFLKDLSTFLTPRSIPSNICCRQNIEIWEAHLQQFKEGLEQLNDFYREVRGGVIDSAVYFSWPELPEFPRLEDNMVFVSFKAAIRNIIQTEEKLYWNQKAEFQSQIARPPNLNAFVNVPYNIQRPQYQPQNNMMMGQALVYGNIAAASLAMQYQPQVQQVLQNQVPQVTVPMANLASNVVQPPQTPSVPGTSKQDERQISDRTSKLMDGLENAAGIQASSEQDKKDKSANLKVGDPANLEDNKGKDVILLDYVLEHCSGATEEEVTVALLSLLDENKGTLSNVPKEKIVEDVRAILQAKKQEVWATPKSPHVTWQNDHSDNECTICFDEFSLQEKYMLPCQHEFHKECIRKWLKTSSVCPICRVHSVIDEDFPPLH